MSHYCRPRRLARRFRMRYSTLMRIIIATGIYPPEVGGPALYAKGVKESLERAGNEAPVVLFGGLRRYPSGVRHLLYAYQTVARSAQSRRDLCVRYL